jgi:hypothetical protein
VKEDTSQEELNTNLDDVGGRIGDISDLPEEIKEQLALAQVDEMEKRIIHTLETRYGGVANLDEIIVGLYRDFRYVSEDRRKLNNKLYRMSKRDLIESVPKKKGVYKLKT